MLHQGRALLVRLSLCDSSGGYFGKLLMPITFIYAGAELSAAFHQSTAGVLRTSRYLLRDNAEGGIVRLSERIPLRLLTRCVLITEPPASLLTFACPLWGGEYRVHRRRSSRSSHQDCVGVLRSWVVPLGVDLGGMKCHVLRRRFRSLTAYQR